MVLIGSSHRPRTEMAFKAASGNEYGATWDKSSQFQILPALLCLHLAKFIICSCYPCLFSLVAGILDIPGSLPLCEMRHPSVCSQAQRTVSEGVAAEISHRWKWFMLFFSIFSKGVFWGIAAEFCQSKTMSSSHQRGCALHTLARQVVLAQVNWLFSQE